MSKRTAKRQGERKYTPASVRALKADPAFQRAAIEAGLWVDVQRPAGNPRLNYRFFSKSSGRELLVFCARTRVVRVTGISTRTKAPNQWQALRMAARLEVGQPVAEALGVRPAA